MRHGALLAGNPYIQSMTTGHVVPRSHDLALKVSMELWNEPWDPTDNHEWEPWDIVGIMGHA